ncbi:hypothetical protein V6Z11_A02G022900 [Gossypium hirsutum]
MKSLYRSLPLLFVVCSLSWVNVLANSHDDFLDCLSSYHPDESFSISKVTYTETNSSYSAVLNAKYPKPSVIVTPLNISHVQATIHCSKKHGLQIRTRSGGHDYEGLSYVSHVPFVVIDLVRFKSVEVDVENEEVWVQSGAIVGEVYYRINERSTNLTFPGAFGYTVGIGGFISGGGDGLLSRKYGLAADNVIDVQFVDASGRKIKLVHVPSIVTIFSVGRTLEQNASQLLHRWQYVAPNLPNDVYSLLTISKWNAGENETKTVLVTFTSLFQCGANELIPLMQERFPELGLVKEDFIEMTWIESVLFINRLSNETSEVLLDRYRPLLPPPFKSKSDFVNEPVLEIALQGLWPQLLEVDEAISVVQTFIAYGAMMDEISETTETPFPHRKGTLYKIHYNIGWQEEENIRSQRYISWMRKLYSYMDPFVSKSPRTAYVNYRDLYIGRNNDDGKASYKQASVWGRKYFKNNFDRLVSVKTKIDPENFFKHEQSIPPHFH